MKRILHLSDLHFGRVHEPALEALREIVIEQEKGFDLIVVTGDWTQRAKAAEFAAASEFVRSLSRPILSVPGNHDVPLYDLRRRFFSPYARYSEFASLTLAHFQDEDISVVGLSTVNPRRVVAGLVREADVEVAKNIFESSARGALKVIACHHPVYDPRTQEWLGPATHVRQLLSLEPDIILSGHSHMQWVETVEFEDRQVLHISAGTSISNRLKEEVNSFHILELDNENQKKSVIVKTYDLYGDGFLERGLSTRRFVF